MSDTQKPFKYDTITLEFWLEYQLSSIQISDTESTLHKQYQPESGTINHDLDQTEYITNEVGFRQATEVITNNDSRDKAMDFGTITFEVSKSVFDIDDGNRSFKTVERVCEEFWVGN